MAVLLMHALPFLLILNPYTIGFFLTIILRLCLYAAIRTILIHRRLFSSPPSSSGSRPNLQFDWKKLLKFFGKMEMNLIKISLSPEDSDVSLELQSSLFRTIYVGPSTFLSPTKLACRQIEGGFIFTFRRKDNDDDLAALRLKLSFKTNVYFQLNIFGLLSLAFSKICQLLFLRNKETKEPRLKAEEAKAKPEKNISSVFSIFQVGVENMRFSLECENPEGRPIIIALNVDNLSCIFHYILRKNSIGDDSSSKNSLKCSCTIEGFSARSLGARSLAGGRYKHDNLVPTISVRQFSWETSITLPVEVKNKNENKTNIMSIHSKQERSEQKSNDDANTIELKIGITSFNELILSIRDVAKVVNDIDLKNLRVPKKKSELLTDSSIKKKQRKFDLHEVFFPIGLKACIVNDTTNNTNDDDDSDVSKLINDLALDVATNIVISQTIDTSTGDENKETNRTKTISIKSNDFSVNHRFNDNESSNIINFIGARLHMVEQEGSEKSEKKMQIIFDDVKVNVSPVKLGWIIQLKTLANKAKKAFPSSHKKKHVKKTSSPISRIEIGLTKGSFYLHPNESECVSIDTNVMKISISPLSKKIDISTLLTECSLRYPTPSRLPSHPSLLMTKAHPVTIQASALKTTMSVILPSPTTSQQVTINATTVTLNETSRATPSTSPCLTFASTSYLSLSILTTSVKEVINIDSSDADLKWSPSLQVLIMLGVDKFNAAIKSAKQSSTGITIIKPSRKKEKLISISSGGEIHLQMTTANEGCIIDALSSGTKVTVNETLPRGPKPSISLYSDNLRVYFNECLPAVADIRRFSFKDEFCIATAEESSCYEERKNKEDIEVVNEEGDILKELIFLGAERVTSRIAPDLQFGRGLNDLTLTTRSLMTALRAVGVMPPKKNERRYQMMTINFDLECIDLSLLETTNSHQTIIIPTLAMLKEHSISDIEDMGLDDIFHHRLRLFLHKTRGTIERNTPPSETQRLLNELDEDPRKDYVYGPDVQGGMMTLDIYHVVLTLDPLHLAVPFVLFHELRYEGLFLLAPLSSEVVGIKKGCVKTVALNCCHEDCRCHHRDSNKDEYTQPDGPCGYEVSLSFAGIPPKVFLDGSLSTSTLKVSFGPEIQPSIPLLNDIIKRMQPPSDEAPPPPMGWWDLLRFWIHGRINLLSKQFCFRWLLDSVDRYDWCIEVSCRDWVFNHEVGTIDMDISDLVLSVPDMAYAKVHNRVVDREDVERRGTFNRTKSQPLFLVPRFSFKLSFSWTVCDHLNNDRGDVALGNKSDTTLAWKHHVPYFDATHDEHDKFKFFRSTGVDMNVNATLSGDESLTNWITLRMDVLPWFMHRSPNATLQEPPPVDDQQPGALPLIESLNVVGKMTETKIALWYGGEMEESDGIMAASTATEEPMRRLVCIFPYLDINSLSCLPYQGAGLISRGTRFESSGFKGILLDDPDTKVDYNDDNCHQQQQSMTTEFTFDNGDGDQGFETIVEKSRTDDYSDDNPLIVEVLQRTYSSRIDPIDDFAATFGSSINVTSRFSPTNKCNIGNSSKSDISPKHIFHRLETSLAEIHQLNYLVETSSILVVDKSLDIVRRRSESFRKMKDAERFDVDKPNVVPWTVVVSRMKLLWTLEIRDSIVSIVGDFIQTLEFLTRRSKENSEKEGDYVSDLNLVDVNIYDSDDDDGSEDDEEYEYEEAYHLVDGPRMERMSTSSSTTIPEDENKFSIDSEVVTKSSLSYLLQRTQPPIRTFTNSLRQISVPEESPRRSKRRSIDQTKSESSPMFDICLLNPQIQLHSGSTGGSIIMAIQGAYVEARRFYRLFLKDRELIKKNIVIDNLLRKQEFSYKLNRFEIYAMRTDVDVDAGLQWLQVKDNPDKEDKTMVEKSEQYISASDHRSFSDTNLFKPVEFEAPQLFRKILNECIFFIFQENYTPPMDLTDEELKTYLRKGWISKVDTTNSSKNEVMDRMDLQLDELSFMLDSHQFKTTIDLIRNLFLMPMPEPREAIYRTTTEDHVLDDGAHDKAASLIKVDTTTTDDLNTVSTKETHDTISISSSSNTQDLINTSHPELTMLDNITTSLTDPITSILNQTPSPIPRLSRNRKIRDALRNASQNLSLHLEKNRKLGGSTLVRRVEWRLGKAKWKVRSDQYVDDVEINFTELHGRHDFFFDMSMISIIDLEDLGIKSLRPGPDSIGFPDPEIVVSTALDMDDEKRCPCQRCGCDFDRLRNESNSCVFHADERGRKGTFSSKKKIWSCCGRVGRDAQGCRSRPHTSQERVILIRLEALPRVIDGLTIYKHFEINIYPSVPHTLIVQVTKSLAKLFMAYFISEEEDKNEAPLPKSTLAPYSGAKDSNDVIRGALSPETTAPMSSNKIDSTRALETESTRSSASIHLDTSLEQDNIKKGMLLGMASIGTSDHTLDSSTQTGTKLPTKITKDNSNNTFTATDTNNDKTLTNKKSFTSNQTNDNVTKQELIFMKLWRIGYINAQISFTGFRVVPDTTDFGISVPAFSRAYKIGTANYLIHKYLSHLIHGVVRSVTGSGLVKIWGGGTGKQDQTTTNRDDKSGSSDQRRQSIKRVERTVLLGNNDERAKLILGTTKKKEKEKKKRGWLR